MALPGCVKCTHAETRSGGTQDEQNYTLSEVQRRESTRSCEPTSMTPAGERTKMEPGHFWHAVRKNGQKSKCLNRKVESLLKLHLSLLNCYSV